MRDGSAALTAMSSTPISFSPRREQLEAPDALRAALVRVIADLGREWRRERELIEAQAAQTIADLRAEVAALKADRVTIKAAIDAAVAERLASLRDGEPGKSVTADDVAPLVRSEVERAVAALPPPEPGRSVDPADVAEMVRASVADAVAALPAPEPGAPGKSVTLEDVAPLVDAAVERAVAAIPRPRDGLDADPVEMAAMVHAAVDCAIAALPPPEPGRSVDPEEVERMVAEHVGRAIDAIPPAAPGKDADPDLVERLVDEKVSAAVAAIPPAEPGAPGKSVDPEDVRAMVREAVAALPPPERGEAGPPGKLPMVRAWADGVHYEADVVTHGGAVYQAQRDTGREPPHEDWLMIAASGQNGEDGRSFTIRGTWSAADTYQRLDVVALNGASFAARRDDPGPCPGEGWQLIASQGKQGKPGEPGKGLRGLPGPPVVSMSIADDGMLTVANADGSRVQCDMYPILSKLGR